MNDYTPYKLDPEFYDRLRSLQNRVPDIRIASGYRSDFEQQQLRDAAQQKGYNPDEWFAPPGESAHNYGVGADLTGNLADVHRYAPLYGLYHALGKDPWHVEPAYVTELGLPYKPPQAPVHFDYKDLTPTGDPGLDANLRNQADARAAQQMKTVPAGIPHAMLAPELRMNLPEARTGATLAENAGQPVTQALGDTEQKSPDQGVSPDQPKQTPAGVGATPDLSAEVTSGQGSVEQRKSIAENKLQSTFNQNANNTNMMNAALAAGSGGGGSGSGQAIVDAMMSQVGKPYSTSGRFGPNAFDCSGITVFGLKAAGLDPGGNQVSTSLQTWGTPVDLQTAYRTPGAMLFVWGNGASGHVEVSRGDGTTIGSSSGGVQVRSAMNRGWTGAALPPGMGVGNAPAQPVSAVPNRIATKDAIKYPSFTVARMSDVMKRGGAPGSVLPTSTGPSPVSPAGLQQTVGNAPLQPDKVTAENQKKLADAQAMQQTAAAGAPPPASQPGNPNPVSSPVAVAPGQTADQASQVSLPKDVLAGSPKGEAMGLAAFSEGQTAVPGAISPEQGQDPNLPQAQQQAQGGDMDSLIRQGMVQMSVDPSNFDAIRHRMMVESGGQNIPQSASTRDVNSGGNEAFGPFQFTHGTFNRFAVGGYEDWHNPYHQVLAYINAVRTSKKYGGNFRHPALMSSGGWSP